MASSCEQLAGEIAALRAEIARIPRVDENKIIQSTRSALQPDISTAVVAGGAVVINKLQPQIDNGINQAKEALTKAFNAESAATNSNNNSLASKRQAEQATRDAINSINEAREAKNIAIKADGKAVNSSSKADSAISEAGGATRSAGEAKRIGNSAYDEAKHAQRKAELSESSAFRANAKAETAQDIARIAARESELAKGIANQSDFKAGKAINVADNSTTIAAKAAREAADATSGLQGLKGVVEGVKNRLGQLGDAIVRAERLAGDAITKAAQAIGISKEALGATARLAGRVLELFNIVATIFTLIEQLAVLETLGARIDAVENLTLSIGNDVSRILGKLLGLQNRIGSVEGQLPIIKNIAIDARLTGENAARVAYDANAAAGRANNAAQLGIRKADQAQLTADGAVRNAAQANENATTAFQKAAEAQVIANKAQTTATEAKSIGSQAKDLAGKAFNKAGEALGVGLTAIALYQSVRFLRGLPGRNGINGVTTVVQIPGVPGRNGIGLPGRNGINGVTTVVQIPGVPGRNGIGLPGRNGINGIDAVPYNDSGLKAFIAAQHNTTRVNSTTQHGVTRVTILTPILAALAPILAICKQIYDLVVKASNVAILALLNVINAKLGVQVLGGLSQFIKTIAENTYLEKALSVMTFAATMHNALMLSNNLGQTLIAIINQVTGFLLPKGVDGTPINFSDSLGKATHLVIANTIGEENYRELSEDWQKANRIYQAASNVFNQISNLGGIMTAGMEVIAGNLGKVGNALRKWGAVGEAAYGFMNPQPNLKGKFFTFLNNSNEKAQAIAMVVAIPIAIKEALGGINSSVADLKREISQTDPKDEQGNPIRDDKGEIVRYKPGLEVPTPIVVEKESLQAKADSGNFIALALEDIFDGGLMVEITPKIPPDDALPDGFDPFEHLQKIYIPQHNALVKRYFADLDSPLGGEWKPNIATSRSSLRVACTMVDSDNQLMMSLRHHLLFDLLGYGRKGLGLFYGSRESQEPPVFGHPRIFFYFSQDSGSLPSGGGYKADAECSVRLMALENTSINLHTKLVEIATEIKTQFLLDRKGIILTKGNLCVSYKDTKNGFPNGSKIFANTEADAIDIYKRICNVTDVIFDELKINVGNPKKPSTVGEVTATQTIMGKKRKLKAYRRVTNVRFKYAYCEIPGEPQPLFLVDTTYRHKSLVKI